LQNGLTTRPVLLESSLAFTEYMTINEQDQVRTSRIVGTSTMDIKDNLIMFTFNNAIYVGEIGKVLTCYNFALV
jgi:hypothetical protein